MHELATLIANPTRPPRAGQLLGAALAYAARGWRVVPLHAPSAVAVCSCIKGSDCESPAKHPRIEGGLLNATTDETVIRGWWEKWPEANIGIRTGSESGIVAIDVDDRHRGDESLAKLCARIGDLPPTATAITPGGRHLLFRHPGGTVRNSSAKLGPGLDVRGDGGYVVGAPSLHASGRLYSLDGLSIDDLQLAELPPALLSELVAPPPEAVDTREDGSGKLREGGRNNYLSSVAGRFRRPGLSPESIVAALKAENAVRCEPPLEDAEVEKIARSIARYPPSDPIVPATARREREPEEDHDPDEELEDTWPRLDEGAALYGLAGDVVNAIRPETEADPVGLLLHLLLFFGSAVGRSPHCLADGSEHHANIFAAFVGETAQGRKGTAANQILRLLRQSQPGWSSECVQGGLASGEGLIYAVRDRIVKEVSVEGGGRAEEIEDEGVSDKRLVCIESEFGATLRVMKRETNILSHLIRKAWDTGELRSMVKKDPNRATDAHISIVAHVTSDELLREFDSVDAANGFGNRFLWACVRRSRFLPHGGNLVDGALAPLANRIDRAIGAAIGLTLVQRNSEANVLWESHYRALSGGGLGLSGAMAARGTAQVLRLSLIYALLDSAREVRAEHLGAALAVWRYCEASVRYIFGDATGDPNADKLLAALGGAADGLTKSEIASDVFGKHLQASRLDQVLSRLVRLEKIEATVVPGPGRHAQRYRLKRTVTDG